MNPSTSRDPLTCYPNITSNGAKPVTAWRVSLYAKSKNLMYLSQVCLSTSTVYNFALSKACRQHHTTRRQTACLRGSMSCSRRCCRTCHLSAGGMVVYTAFWSLAGDICRTTLPTNTEPWSMSILSGISDQQKISTRASAITSAANFLSGVASGLA